MEIKFQTPRNNVFSTSKQKPNRSKSGKKNKFVGVRQRPSGKWVAEIKNTTQKIRMWLGTFNTAEEAARAYDEAAFLLRGSNTRTNFVDHGPPNSPISLKIISLLNQKKASKENNTSKSTKSPNKTNSKTSSQTNNPVSPIWSNQDFDMIDQLDPEHSFSFHLPKPVTETRIRTDSQTSTHSDNTSPDTSDCSSLDLRILDDDAYRPDLSQCFNNGGGNGVIDYDQSNNAFGDEFYQLLTSKDELFVPKSIDLVAEISEHQFPEFEHMKVQRQISASLYAMNGVNEYWQNFKNPSNALLDLPAVYQMFCTS